MCHFNLSHIFVTVTFNSFHFFSVTAFVAGYSLFWRLSGDLINVYKSPKGGCQQAGFMSRDLGHTLVHSRFPLNAKSILCCADDGVHITQNLWNLLLRDRPETPGHLGTLLWVSPLEQRLDKMDSRGPFPSQPYYTVILWKN